MFSYLCRPAPIRGQPSCRQLAKRALAALHRDPMITKQMTNNLGKLCRLYQIIRLTIAPPDSPFSGMLGKFRGGYPMPSRSTQPPIPSSIRRCRSQCTHANLVARPVAPRPLPAILPACQHTRRPRARFLALKMPASCRQALPHCRQTNAIAGK